MTQIHAVSNTNNPIDLTGTSSTSQQLYSGLMSKLEMLEADLSSIKGQSKSAGLIKSFSGIIPNIQCVKDVEAWLTTAFRRLDGDGEPY
jgi:hypothetical protein